MINLLTACDCCSPGTASIDEGGATISVDDAGSRDRTCGMPDCATDSLGAERYRKVDRRGLAVHQEGTSRTRSGHQSAQSAVLETGLQHCTQSRLQVQRNRLQIIDKRPAKALGIPTA
jgi:hypothetical protein